VTRETKLLFLLGAAAVLWAASRTQTGQRITDTIMSKIARGIRNNNPGNIRKGKSQWQGMSPTQTDPAFVQFTAPEYGIRALAVLLKNYFAQGVDTLAKVAAKYAPSNENDTGAYVASLEKSTGIGRNEKLTVNDLTLVVTGIIRHENGTNPYPIETIQKGVQLA
jgi:hypothetical protein